MEMYVLIKQLADLIDHFLQIFKTLVTVGLQFETSDDSGYSNDICTIFSIDGL